METAIIQRFMARPEGPEAEAILRACVHCGFCTATCPTYQLLGDELDGPRGRIYLIKQVLEGQTPTRRTLTHLDRCLTCRACETTCPSGVRYGHLVDLGRALVEEQVPRTPLERLLRAGLRQLLPHPGRFRLLLRAGALVRPLLPTALKRKLPPLQTAASWPAITTTRRMLVLEGCAQKAATPNTNAAAARVLARLGIELVRVSEAGCCGAVDHHLNAPQAALARVRRNIDAWWPQLEAGAEAIMISASGCGAMVKDYGHLLRDDPDYAARAARVADLARDLGEVIAAEPLDTLDLTPPLQPIAFHAPCTLQHGLKLPGVVESILQRCGFTLTTVADGHLCCGSAGTYSITQPSLSKRLLDNKLDALTAGEPALIATANIGCQLHLASGTGLAVRHWIELLDEALVSDAAADGHE